MSKLLTDVWSNGNVELLDDLIGPGYRSHIEETNPVRTSHQTGPIIPRTEIAAYRSGIPNLSLDVTTVLAEGDTVVAIWMMSGDNTADASVEDGDEVIPSSGRPIETTGVGTFIVKDGKITEAAYRWYPLGPLTQLRFLRDGCRRDSAQRRESEPAEMTDTPNPVILDPAKPIFQPLFQVSPALPESVDSDIKPIWIAFDVPPRRSHTGFVAPLPRRKSMPGERQSPRITIDH